MTNPTPLALALVGAIVLLSRPASAEVEVRISIGSGKPQVTLAAAQLAVFDARTGRRLRFSEAPATIRVQRAGRGIRLRGGPFTKEDAPSVIFEAEKGVRVDGRLYLGRVSVRPSSGKSGLEVVNRLPVETYLLGIVGSEMNPNWPAEALKAQAVAARTYAMERRMRTRAANKPYDLDATVLSQVYTGAERITPSVIAAVNQTRGQVLSYRHHLVEALFHSTCGGRTAAAGSVFHRKVPYLKGRPCGWCKQSNRFRWSVSMPLSVVSKKLSQAKLISGQITAVERERRQGKVTVRVGKKTVSVHPRDMRAAIGYGELYSQDFTAHTKGDKVVLEGRGFGHRVGMCQWGAKGLADRGSSYQDILAHYYDGAGVKRIY